MKRIPTTPTRARTLAIYIAIAWLCSPLVEAIYYETEFRRGSYPPEADTIIIPIMQFTIGWLVITPLAVAFVYWALKNYPGKVSLFSWNKKKRIKSYFFTAIFVIFAGSNIVFAIQSIFRNHPVDVISSLIGAHISLILRSSIIMAYNKNLKRTVER